MSYRGEHASVFDVKAGDEALVYLENMPDGLIEKHFAIKVSLRVGVEPNPRPTAVARADIQILPLGNV